MRKAICLFASHKATHPTSQPIKVGKGVIWIRVLESYTEDLIDALDYADENRLPTEMVLNTVYKTVEKHV